MIVAAGLPVVITEKVPVVPTVNVALVPLVMAGGCRYRVDSQSEALRGAGTDPVGGGDRERVAALAPRGGGPGQGGRPVAVVSERDP